MCLKGQMEEGGEARRLGIPGYTKYTRSHLHVIRLGNKQRKKVEPPFFQVKGSTVGPLRIPSHDPFLHQNKMNRLVQTLQVASHAR